MKITRQRGNEQALVIVRTAFQGWLFRRILPLLGDLTFDFLQVSYNDSPEEQGEFDALSPFARNAWYLRMSPRRYDFVTQYELFKALPTACLEVSYSKLLLSSIDAPIVGVLAARHRTADLITWDDGISNILPGGSYQTGSIPLRAQVYRQLLRAESISGIRSRITRHFTIFPGMGNVVPDDRIATIDAILAPRTISGKTPGSRYFIGQPFQEAIAKRDVAWLDKKAEELQPDWYLRHPREHKRICLSTPELEKKGAIAEEAILQNSEGHNFTIIGSFSTTLFTLTHLAAETVMILPPSVPGLRWLTETGTRLGMTVVRKELDAGM